MIDPPKEPAQPMIREVKAAEAFATHQWDFTPIRMWYDLDRAKWDASNRMCLMVIRSSIMVVIRGAILNYETSKEYLKKVESQFTVSSKMYASIIIKRLMTEKYSFDNGVRTHPENEQHGF
jgi:hypothetical protein